MNKIKVLQKKTHKKAGLETIGDYIKFAAREFKKAKIYFGHGTQNADDEALFLVTHFLQLPPDIDLEIFAVKLSPSEKKLLDQVIKERIKKRIPAAYLTHTAWFAGLDFYVDERVLIPRSPIAELIENRFAPWIDPLKVRRVLDIGTGSGCLAIACAYAFPKARIDAVDIDSKALAVAKINCEKHKVTERVKLFKSDLFSAVSNKVYDVIISNPPYVGKKELQQLPKEYYHEPQLALLAGMEGIETVDRILKEAGKHLASNGILIVEVGNSQPLIIKKYPKLPFVWLEFERGESEVFLLDASELKKLR